MKAFRGINGLLFGFLLFLPSLLLAQEKRTEKIVGGKNYTIQEVPWQVALVFKGEGSYFDRQFCGGTIINEYWILTATHCIDDLTSGQFEVLAGITNLNDTPTTNSDIQVLQVSQVIMHPDFEQGISFTNDIALLRLSTPLNLEGDAAKSIPYLTQSMAATGLADAGKSALISGWGNVSQNTNNYPLLLQGVETQIISNELANSSDGYNGLITAEMMVAGDFANGGIDACQGDSGGPLVVRNNEDTGWVIAGVTSWGIGCAQPQKPGVYARVSAFENWIRENSGVGNAPLPEISAGVQLIGLGNSQKQDFALCQSGTVQIFEEVLLVNEGNAALDSVLIRFGNGASASEQTFTDSAVYRFEQPLEKGNSTVLIIDFATLDQLQETVVSLEAVLPNGLTDGRPENNTLSNSVRITEGEQVFVQITPDSFPEEISWKVFDGNGEVVFVGDSIPADTEGEAYSQIVCLPDGSYTFEFYDSFSDGLSAPGFISIKELTSGEEVELYNLSGDYGEKAAVTVGIPFLATLQTQLEAPVDTRFDCQPYQESFSVDIFNTGQLPINSAKIIVENENAKAVLRWDGYLPAGNQANINFNLSGTAFIDESFSVYVDSLNLSPYLRTQAEDSIFIDLLTAENPLNATLEVNTDGFPEETSWQIFNAANGKMLFESPVYEQGNRQNIFSFCAAEGSYDFRLFDSFGDGFEVETAAQLFYGDSVLFSVVDQGLFFIQTRQFYLIHGPTEAQIEAITTDSVLIRWQDNSAIEEGYYVEYALGNENYQVAATVSEGVSQMKIGQLQLGEQYRFRVRAYKGTSVSLPSEPLTIVTTGLHHLSTAKINVFPNPATNTLTISGSGDSELFRADISIYNINGALIRKMTRVNLMTEAAQVNIEDLNNGLYFLRIETQNTTTIKKLVKK